MGMKALFSFMFFFFGVFSLYAQSTFSGKVSDSEKQILPGAQVILLKADTLFAATLTDQDGKFVFRDIPADVYGLQILAMGYTPIEEKERKIEGHHSFSFTLEKEMNVDLDVVEVTANQNDRVERTATGQRFFLSEEAKKKRDPYLVLQEIPVL